MSATMFIKFESPNVVGHSTVPGHEKEIEVLAWNHGFVQPTNPRHSIAGVGVVEQATHQNFTFTKYTDMATPELLKLCWTGKQIGKAVLTCYWNDATGTSIPYLIITMEHVVLANFSVSGGPGDIPVENISLDYGSVSYNYAPTAVSNAARSVQHNLVTQTVQ